MKSTGISTARPMKSLRGRGRDEVCRRYSPSHKVFERVGQERREQRCNDDVGNLQGLQTHPMKTPRG